MILARPRASRQSPVHRSTPYHYFPWDLKMMVGERLKRAAKQIAKQVILYLTKNHPYVTDRDH